MSIKLSPGVPLTKKGFSLNQTIPDKYNAAKKAAPKSTPTPVSKPDNRYSDPPVGGYNPEQVALSSKKSRNPYAKALNNTA